jgi:protein transport protein SEC20
MCILKYSRSRTLYRKAQLQAKHNAEAAKRKERELLFSGARDGGSQAAPGRRKAQERLTQDELEVNASNDVTAALRRTHQLMEAELSRSQFAQETLGNFQFHPRDRSSNIYLEQSTAALSSLSESYTNLDSLLSSSRSLVSTLLRSQKSDTWYLETAFWILVITNCWLIWRRWLYGPTWWLVWLPIKLLYKLAVVTLSATGILGAVAGNQASLSTSTSLIVQRSATGGLPTYAGTMQPQSVVVGGGNRGGGFRQHMPEPSPSSRSEGGQSEETRQEERRPPRLPEEKPEQGEAHGGEQGQGGTNIDDISEEEHRRQEQIPRNPKKRMFEADVEAAKRE